MKNFLMSLIVIVFSVNLYSQVKVMDDIGFHDGGRIILKSIPHKSKHILCEFYSMENILKYQCEFITKLNEIKAKEFYNYLNAKNILLDGKYIEFYENGDTLGIAEYDEGKVVGRKIQFYKDKAILSELLTNPGGEATFLLYYPNGKKKMEFHLFYNIKSGEEIHYYENGNIKLSMQYNDGKLDGELTEYYQNNNLKRKETYEKDKIIKKECFDDSGKLRDYKSLIDSLEFFKLQNNLITLKSIPKIKNYLKENSIIFSCIISEDKLSIIDNGTLPSNILKIIKDWSSSLKWKAEKYAGEPVKTKVNFNISGSSGNYFVIRRPYDLDLNNHVYSPEYNITPYDYPDTKENRAFVAEFEETPFVMVEDMPQFIGGGSIIEYVTRNINYPKEAVKSRIQGTVYVQFIIAKDGSIKDPKVYNKVHPLLDKEALRIIVSMPKWKPGYKRMKPVNIQYIVPINFVLQEKIPENGESKNN